jgi:hypothetical protein
MALSRLQCDVQIIAVVGTGQAQYCAFASTCMLLSSFRSTFAQSWLRSLYGVQVLKDEVDAVLARLHAVQSEVDDLEKQTDTSRRRLCSAETLTSSLGDERVRWAAAATTTEASITAAPVTSLLDAAALTHLGPLTHAQRMKLIQEWKRALFKCGVARAVEIEQWSVISSLGDDLEVRKWCLQVCASTDVMSELNACVVTSGAIHTCKVFCC